jgi:hypothetical protein
MEPMNLYVFPTGADILKGAIVLLLMGGIGALVTRRYPRAALGAYLLIVLACLVLGARLIPPSGFWRMLPASFWARESGLLAVAVLDIYLIWWSGRHNPA